MGPRYHKGSYEREARGSEFEGRKCDHGTRGERTREERERERRRERERERERDCEIDDLTLLALPLKT